jgi:pimeloyl-ACP methyl ester carboxylesterase
MTSPTETHAAPSAPRFGLRSPSGLILSVEGWARDSAQAVFLHGYGEGGYAWRDCAARLAPTRGALLLDFRGHGHSDWDPLGRYDLQDHVADVVDLLGDRDAPLVLVGHSMGASVALLAAQRLGDRVQALVLADIGCGGGGAAVDVVRQQLRHAIDGFATREAALDWLVGQRPLSRRALLAGLVDEAFREEGGLIKARCDPALLLPGVTVGLERAALLELLQRLRRPVLIARGAGSAVLERGAFEAMIARSEQIVGATIPVSGHAIMTDNPDAFVAAARAFLERLPNYA